MTEVHGTRRMIRDLHCGCEVCKAAVAREQNLYRLRRAANGGPLLIDKTGAVRRIQALMAIGWPRREISYNAGWKGDACALILDGRKNQITVATDQRVRDVYNRLCMTPGPSTETRRRAQLKGWVPPLGWDDIDTDPEPPETAHASDELDEAVIIRLLAGETVPASKPEKVEAMRRWIAWGRSEKSLCEIHGWHDGRYGPREDVAV